MRLDKKDAKQKTRDFLGFSAYFAVFLTFFEIRILVKIKIPNSSFKQGRKREPLSHLVRYNAKNIDTNAKM